MGFSQVLFHTLIKQRPDFVADLTDESSATDFVTDLTDRSSATDFLTDLTDRRRKEVRQRIF